MRVLVTAASRHGGTTSISREVAHLLHEAGHAAFVAAPDEVHGLDGVDAVVLGSAVYGGRWMDQARHFARRLSDQLEQRPVWLFSSGPVGDPPGRGMDRVDASEVERRTGALEHRVFGGRLDDTLLSRGERARARRARVAPGDYRQWGEIRCWAEGLAYQLDQQALAAARTTPTEDFQP
jgi:menaquinone-dependent protoporphyrinogen oxidase